jgi:mannose-6-phosphate isomerase
VADRDRPTDEAMGDSSEGRRGPGRHVPAEEYDPGEFVTAGGGTAAAHDPVRVEKPWGYELIWAHTDLYVGKILFVRAGEALSLQFHEEKDETLHLLEGSLRLETGSGVHAMAPRALGQGQSIRIRPGVLHRMTAVTDCTILEASTPELDDVVRVADRYGRAEEEGK